MPGQIRLGMKYCSKSVEIHGFTPNLSSISGLVELGIIPTNSTGIYLNGFTPNSTGRIRPDMKYCSNWVEIHGFTPNLTGHEILLKLHLNSWIYTQFDRLNLTGHEILLKIG